MTSGHKADAGKLRYDLLPSSLDEVIRVLMYGAAKYPADLNWQLMPEWRIRYGNALMRHGAALLRGEDFDPESGFSHAAHAAVNGLFLAWFTAEESSEVQAPVGPKMNERSFMNEVAQPWTQPDWPDLP